MMTCTTDEYVANLYNCLRECLVITQDCVEKEAQRQKWLYDHKVGAIELRPGEPNAGTPRCLSRTMEEAQELVGW